MVVIAPTVAHQTVLLHRHIRSRREFQEACATSLTTLHWCTGVLLNAQQLEEVMKVVLTDHELHKGRVLISTRIRSSPQVQGMVAGGWRLSEAFPLQLHRVWKNTRHVPKRNEWVHVLEQEEGVVEPTRQGRHRTSAQAMQEDVASSPAQVEVPVWLRRWERGEARDATPTTSALTYSELTPARCSPAIGDHLQGPTACELGCGRRGTQATMRAHVQETHGAMSSSVLDVLRHKKSLDQALPHPVEALLSSQLLSQWYDDTDPEDRQIRRTGLILDQVAEEWRSMGWSMTQISGLAQTLFKARIRWIDGISSARRAMEQAVYQIRERSRASVGSNAMLEVQLKTPLYAQCLGFDAPRIRRAPAPSRAGWVGAAQVGPFAPEEAGRSSDEEANGESGTR